MRKMYGWQFFEKLETLSPQIGRSMQDAVGMVASGERAIGYTAEAAALASVARGEPVGIVYPVDGAVLAVAASAVMKSARHPSAARLFLEYLYSVEAAAVQAAHFASPLRSGTPRPSTMKSPGDIKIVRPSVAELVEQVPEIIERWRDTFGN
jgi:iron(III) transport system substrate-binding protein